VGSVALFFFFQAEDGIRDWSVTGVQTCALPISGATAIAGGAGANTASTNCAVAGGAVYCWGDNTYGTAGIAPPSATPITFATKRSEERRVGKESRAREGAGR